MRQIRTLAVILVLAAWSQPRPITIFMAGDSTMAEKPANRRPETGWGEMLQQYFAASDVRVSDQALNGRSTRTFIAEHHWQAIVDSVRPGDYVVIQFGHNDEAPEKVDRYTPPADYRANLVRMVADVRSKHGLPLLCTPVVRRQFDAERHLVDTHGVYPGIVRAVATEQHVPLIDMQKSSAELLSRIGPDSSLKLFLQVEPGETPNYPAGVHDNTHFRPLGAELMAGLFVAGVRQAVPDLAAHIKSR